VFTRRGEGANERAIVRACVRACVRCSGVRARPICLTQRTADGAAIDGLRAAGERRSDRQPADGEQGWDFGRRVGGMGAGIGGVGGEKMAGRLTLLPSTAGGLLVGAVGWQKGHGLAG
jgi:hypothetical protein